MNFVALDFETANERRDSACSLGLTTVSDGRIVETAYKLIRPPELRFSHWNTMVHGLREADVADACSIGELWPSIQSLIEGNLIVAHNASFDMSVLRHSLASAGIAVPRVRYVCSLNIARRTWPELTSHNLRFLADSFGWELDHHNAASDANVAANLILLAAQQMRLNCPFQLAEALGVLVGEVFSHDEWMPCSSPRTNRAGQALDIELPNGYDISQHPFFEKNIEFTGTLDLFGRRDAQRVVALFGGRSNNCVSKKTHFLVIGALDVRTLVAGKHESGKLERARSLKEAGCDIQIISEADFAEMIFSPVMASSNENK